MYVCVWGCVSLSARGGRKRQRESFEGVSASSKVQCGKVRPGERERGSWSLRMSISADKGKREGGWVRGVYCEAV